MRTRVCSFAEERFLYYFLKLSSRSAFAVKIWSCRRALGFVLGMGYPPARCFHLRLWRFRFSCLVKLENEAGVFYRSLARVVWTLDFNLLFENEVVITEEKALKGCLGELGQK